MARINGIWGLALSAYAGLWENPVDRTSYPRINGIQLGQLSTHKRYMQVGVSTHKRYTRQAAKPSSTRDSEGFLYVYLYVNFTYMCLRLSVERRDKAAPSHIRLGAQTAFA
jgi:hypothetical protein